MLPGLRTRGHEFDVRGFKFRQRFAALRQCPEGRVGQAILVRVQGIAQERERARQRDGGVREALADEPAPRAALAGMTLELTERAMHLRTAAREPGIMALVRGPELTLVDLIPAFVSSAAREGHELERAASLAPGARQQGALWPDQLIEVIQQRRGLEQDL